MKMNDIWVVSLQACVLFCQDESRDVRFAPCLTSTLDSIGGNDNKSE
jgi:hypothetical protein